MISKFQFEEMKRRLSPKIKPEKIEREGDLHDEIEATLKFKRWYYVHSRMDRATTSRAGTPDFIIAAPGGVTYWIECKRKGGKLSVDQNITRHILGALGHKFALVFSLQDFLNVINPPKETIQPEREWVE